MFDKKLYMKEYRRLHRAKLNKQRRNWCRKNRNKVKAIARRTYIKHKSKRRAIATAKYYSGEYASSVMATYRGVKKSRISYDSVHRGLLRHRGSATKHLCIDCGLPAKHWALVHSSPNLIVDVHANEKRKGSVFSPFYDDYVPKCVACNNADGHPTLEGWTQRLLELGRTSIPLK